MAEDSQSRWHRFRRMVTLVVVLLGLSGGILGISWWWAGQPTISFRLPVTITRTTSAHSSVSTMPGVIQLTLPQAEQRLEAHGVHQGQIAVQTAIVGTEGQPGQYPSGWVVAESPVVGSSITGTTKIGLIVAP